MLSLSEALAGAAMKVPAEIDIPPVDYCSASFEATVLEFSDEAYIGFNSPWMSEDDIPEDQDAIATTLAPAQITRVENGTDNIMSGKDSIQTPEPPLIVMILIGVGLMFFLPSLRTGRRSGRRKARRPERAMAHI
jgi:hypothetical protein